MEFGSGLKDQRCLVSHQWHPWKFQNWTQLWSWLVVNRNFTSGCSIQCIGKMIIQSWWKIGILSFRYPTFSSLKTIPTVSVCTWNFRAKYVKAKKQAGLSRSTLGPYYKVSSNNSIVLHSPQELNKESLRLVYKIWVMTERCRKKFFLLSQNTM